MKDRIWEFGRLNWTLEIVFKVKLVLEIYHSTECTNFVEMIEI